jgi:hypothetical protein
MNPTPGLGLGIGPFSNVCLLTKSAQESSSPAIRIKTFSSNKEPFASWEHTKMENWQRESASPLKWVTPSMMEASRNATFCHLHGMTYLRVCVPGPGHLRGPDVRTHPLHPRQSIITD